MLGRDLRGEDVEIETGHRRAGVEETLTFELIVVHGGMGMPEEDNLRIGAFALADVVKVMTDTLNDNARGKREFTDGSVHARTERHVVDGIDELATALFVQPAFAIALKVRSRHALIRAISVQEQCVAKFHVVRMPTEVRRVLREIIQRVDKYTDMIVIAENEVKGTFRITQRQLLEPRDRLPGRLRRIAIVTPPEIESIAVQHENIRFRGGTVNIAHVMMRVRSPAEKVQV